MFVIVSSITNWSGVFSRVPLNHVCWHMRADTRTLLSGLRLLHWEREGTENMASQSQFHTFSAVVRPVRHGCLWIWAGQGLVTPHCIEDRGISFTRTSIPSSTKQVLSSVKSSPHPRTTPCFHLHFPPTRKNRLSAPEGEAGETGGWQRKRPTQRDGFKLHTNQYRPLPPLPPASGPGTNTGLTVTVWVPSLWNEGPG